MRADTPVERKNPDPVRSPPKRNATKMSTSARWRATSAASTRRTHACPEVCDELVVAEVAAGQHRRAGHRRNPPETSIAPKPERF